MSEGETSRRRGRRSLPAAFACLALVALPLAGCGDDDSGDGGSSGGGSAKPAVTVNIASFKFLPDPIKVKAGGEVNWVNQDKAPHTAETEKGATGAFNTGRLDLGDKKAVKLDQAGKFSYYCIYHRFMTGTVEVVE